MVKSGFVEKIGTVTEALPDGKFRITLEIEEREVIGYLSGKMRKHKITVLIGDRVKIEFSEYDQNNGRITFRLK